MGYGGADITVTYEDGGDEMYVEVNGEQIAHLNHDEHGYTGMHTVEDVLKSVANKLYFNLRVEHE